MNRFDRVTSLLVLLQTRRWLTGAELAARFGVSLRTIYRDMQTLAAAGVPLAAAAGQGYSLAEGYRLPPVLFSREEATALFTAEKLLSQHADPATGQLMQAAMDKLRAVLRRPDRDYLAALGPRVQVLRPAGRRAQHAAPGGHYPVLLAAVGEGQLVRLHYQAGPDGELLWRDVEPIGIYYGQQWHLVAYCRLRQAFRDFRLDRIAGLRVLGEHFQPRPDTLHSYWTELAARQPQQLAVVRFLASARTRLDYEKHHLGWRHERQLADGCLELTFQPGCLQRLASWLLPFGPQATPVSPPELAGHLADAARAAYAHFAENFAKKSELADVLLT